MDKKEFRLFCLEDTSCLMNLKTYFMFYKSLTENINETAEPWRPDSPLETGHNGTFNTAE